MATIEELNKMLEEQNPDIRHCMVCGTPFLPRRKNQKLCGDPECKRLQHLKVMRENDKYRAKHRESNRTYMRKKRAEKRRQAAIEEFWDEAEKKEQRIREDDGLTYAQRQVRNTLSQVPKINTEL